MILSITIYTNSHPLILNKHPLMTILHMSHLMVLLSFSSHERSSHFTPKLLKLVILIDGLYYKITFPSHLWCSFLLLLIDWRIFAIRNLEDYRFIWCFSPNQIFIVVFIFGALHVLRLFCFVSGKFVFHFVVIFFSIFPNLKSDCICNVPFNK